VDGELTAWLSARKKVTASVFRRPAMVARKRCGETELGCSSTALRRWRDCSARHRQDGEQASTSSASATAPASSVWRAPDDTLGPVELRDASVKMETASGAQ
jgi:hypothetical protein